MVDTGKLLCTPIVLPAQQDSSMVDAGKRAAVMCFVVSGTLAWKAPETFLGENQKAIT